MPIRRAPVPRFVALVAAAFGLVSAIGACGTDAVGVEACRQVEAARCLWATSCGIDLTMPVHRDTPASDVDACVRFYHDQCLHGLVTTKEPGAVQVSACVDAINTGNCAIVKAPETSAACGWLLPPAQQPAADAATDAATGSADAADAAPSFRCLAGCTDDGTAIPLCAPHHQCRCPPPLSQVPPGCYLAGSTEGGSLALCCD